MPETIGEILRNSRTEQKKTIAQVANATHIRPYYLEALENDEREILPSDVQGRGFLRLYADYLGLNTQSLLDLWRGVAVETPVNSVTEDEFQDSELNTVNETFENEDTTETEPIPDDTFSDDSQEIEEDKSQQKIPKSNAVSQKIFTEIGEKLTEQRELLGLSLEDVERFTHVRLHYLEALERGQIEDLPSPVQGRGMLSNYARFLDLDVEALLLQFADGLQNRRIERVQPTSSKGIFTRRQVKNANGFRRLFTPDLLIGSGVIIVLFVFVIWTAAQVSAMRKLEVQATLPPIPQMMIMTASIEPSETQLSTPQPAPISSNQELPAAAEENTGLPQITGTLPPIGDAPLQVYVIANQRAFLRIISDKKEVFNGRVVPGNAYAFSGKDQIELITGNAAALQVFFNQNDLGTLGLVGEVSRLIFNQNGITTPTPLFTATPTATQQPTVTLQPSPTAPTPTITVYLP